MNRLSLLSIFLLGFVTSSFAQETRRVGYYDELKVSHGIEVILVKGDPGTIKVTTSGIDPDDIITDVEWETLKIRFRNTSFWDEEKYERRDVTIEVPFSKMHLIDVGTGALVKSKSVIKEEELRLEASTGGELYLEIDVESMRADISMGSIFEASGVAENLRVKVNMGAVVDLRDLESDIATIKASMGGEIKVTCLKEVDASASMGGVITVYGAPDRRYTSDNLGGEINFRKVN